MKKKILNNDHDNDILVNTTTYNEGDVKKHLQTVHEGQRNHKCNACGKSFSNSGKLKQHIRYESKKLQMLCMRQIICLFKMVEVAY